MTQCYKLAAKYNLVSLAPTTINEVLNCLSFLGGITKLPARQNRVGFTSSFAIGLCVSSGKIANVLVNEMAKVFFN
jgi:hypothetical protein